MNKQLIDLSHIVEDGMITYKGLPAPIICDYWSYDQSREKFQDAAEFHIGKIEMVANTGTYLDAPSHRYREGKDLSQLPLTSLANLDGVAIHLREDLAINNQRAIDVALLQNKLNSIELSNKAIIIDTGWSNHWRTDNYYTGQHPFLTKEAATFLRNAQVKLVGIDSYNIDDTADLARPAHTILLGAEIPIVEHMTNLSSLPQIDFKFFAVPVKVKGFGTFPVRTFAVI